MFGAVCKSASCPGLSVDDVDVFEINEAFASQVTSVVLSAERCRSSDLLPPPRLCTVWRRWESRWTK